MSLYNSNSSIKYLLYLILFVSAGCTEKATKQAYINESPAHIAGIPTVAETIPTPTAIDPQKIPTENTIVSKPAEKTIRPPLTVWDRLLALYSLPEIEHPRIDKEVKKYLKHPQYLAKMQERAEPYIYFILNEIEAKQIPGEIALLPIVESAFRPTAVSPSRAAGLWQFMPATGRLYGLKQNWWYDGRNDIYTSTKAATSYLKELSQAFGDDWLLALASYNGGRGTIRKAIRRNRNKNLKTDYWSLSLNSETAAYVPRLLALAKIFSRSEYYNIPLKNIPNKAYFSVVNIDSQIDLNIATKMAGTPFDDFVKLNPGFKRASTDPDGPFHLLIKADKAASFKEKLAKTHKKDRLHWRQHLIKQGETLGHISKIYNTTVNALKQSNRLKNSRIRAGKVLLIPSQSSNNKQLYIVKKGDTFWEIARLFDVKSRDIALWNNISLKKALQPGQKLIIKES